MNRRTTVVLVVVAVFVIAGFGLIQLQAARRTGSPANLPVTIDGYDSTGVLIDPINVWNNYQTRDRVVATVHHGERITLLLLRGDAALVRTASGVEGWLTAKHFIKELKE